MSSLLQAAEACGGAAADHLLRVIDGALECEKPNWRRVLFRFFTSAADRARGTRPSRRHLVRGFAVPGKTPKPGLTRLLAMVDVSGSMAPQEHEAWLHGQHDICRTFRKAEIVNVCWSTAVYSEPEHIVTITAANRQDKFPIYGGGGTTVRPVVQYMKDHGKRDHRVIGGVIVTDGMIMDYPSKPPPFPVLWLLTHRAARVPPWGEVAWLTPEC